MNNNIITNNTNKLMKNSSLGYVTEEIKNNQVITLPKNSTAKATAIKEVNKTLCGLLIFSILISMISYYFVVDSEIKLNKLSKDTTNLNVKNAELQNRLDKLKSFNNVDLTIQKSSSLQRPEQVIETVDPGTPKAEKKSHNTSKPKAWTIGY